MWVNLVSMFAPKQIKSNITARTCQAFYFVVVSMLSCERIRRDGPMGRVRFVSQLLTVTRLTPIFLAAFP